ncbi:MAG TPA: FAD-binding protein [Salinivirgaceae bacterium]|nr:FAD-binding protein [Salinivirgaceae bacterium]
MVKTIETILSPKEAFDNKETIQYAARKLFLSADNIKGIRWKYRSIDARKYPVRIHSKFDVFVNEKPCSRDISIQFPDVSRSPEIHIVGSGPAGYFAALELIQLGLKPIVFERGKNVSDRKRDIAQLLKNFGLNPDSNYAFGEGGAGTFSDGKLYTRVKRKEEIQKVLQIFYHHGAQENILYESHPHIGTDVLPRVIENIRRTIERCGGKILFNHKVTDFVIRNNQIAQLEINHSERIDVSIVILATGHSARDIYQILLNHNIKLESKGFAMGVRIEHPQELINTIQYHGKNYDRHLPPASYSITKQIDGRGVYSFCMCPGGIIVPASSQEKQLVVNGMSNSKRNSPFANSGFVVELRPDDMAGFSDDSTLGGLKFQIHLEQLAYDQVGKNQMAPAQRMSDFVQGKISQNIPQNSYLPGVVSFPLHEWLPEPIGSSLRKAFMSLGKQIPGFLTNEAIIVGVESRSSSPIRIPRDKEKLSNPQICNLFPCGEGAGFAGGIVSSAIDGMLAARSVYKIIHR